jgi:hypothetical protein
MITKFELKNRKGCRCFYKMPYFVKNLVLLAIMGFILVYIYFVNFLGHSKLEMKSIMKVIAGLNSHTFNFLLQHEKDLMITQTTKTVKVTSVRTVDFYSSCISLNRPCILPGMAKTWPAYEKWAYRNGGTEYLASKI